MRWDLTTNSIIQIRPKGQRLGDSQRAERGSESDCLLGQLDRILRISDSEAGVKEKSGGVVGEEGKCGNDVVGCQQETDEGWIFYL